MKHFGKHALHLLGGIALLAALVAVTMWLWNALIPDIIGWKSITYWQAAGLLVLTHLIFGHIARPSLSDRQHEKHLHEMMHGMSRSEKREFIRRRMRRLCENDDRDQQSGEAARNETDE